MRYTFFFVIISSFRLSAQIANLDSVPNEYFSSYDIIFIGEQHKISDNEKIESRLISLIKDQKTKVCMESSFDLNIPIENTFSKIDTLNYNLSLFTNYGREPILFKYLYNNKMRPRAIDIFNADFFLKNEILKIYNQNNMPVEIKNDLNEFMNIGVLKFPVRYKNMKKYFKFMDKFNLRRNEHANFLGKDSTKVIEYFEALDAMLYSENDMSKDAPVASNFREGFMCKMLKKEIDNSNNTKIVSINGHIHTILDNKSSWIRNPNFQNLASLVKKQYPNKKIASVYLLQMEQDTFFRKEYTAEFNYLADRTLMGKRYVIEISENNTPFKNLVGKYTHIVVY
jgi:hypothetical protein